MLLLCPRTHYDLIKELRGSFVEAIAEEAAARPDDAEPYIDDDIDQEHFVSTVRTSLAGYAKAHLDRQGYRTGTMTDEDLVKSIPGEVATPLLSSMRFDYLFIGNYEASGKKTFFFGDRLTRKLADTELNMPSELLVPPFPSCMFVYDNQTARDALFAFHGMKAPDDGVVTVYVNYYKHLETGPSLGLYITHTNRRKESSVAMIRSLNLAPGGSVEAALRTDWTKVNGSQRQHEVIGYETSAPEDDTQFYGPGLRMVRIVANSVLYLASADPDVSEPQSLATASERRHIPPKELRKIAASTTSVEYIDVGRRSTDYSASQSPTQVTLGHRLKVRGHWKNQAHGPSMSLRKYIHVEPYWKGPDAAEVINKPYVAR
ncbi:hypothetical protein G6L37_00785 [Agrobacterium rubi]|nr:hypothetical protein [Agrobacterium rubi]NTF23926.1 hypothetical protein [Agrobacterium rubi]